MKRCILILTVAFLVLSVATITMAQNKPTMTVGVVNFHAVWGDKAANLEKMKDFIRKAGEKGTNLLLFPEMALTGYEVVDDWGNMQRKEAEPVPGPSTLEIAELAKEHKMYVVFGMPERDSLNPSLIYNSAAIITPEGGIDSYRKIHPYLPENKWCVKGSVPVAFETPWGLVGVGICYDTYYFPEFPRIYAVRGAFLYLNPTVISKRPGRLEYFKTLLGARAQENQMFVASANLVGTEVKSTNEGKSMIIGPCDFAPSAEPIVYALSDSEEEMITAELDPKKLEAVRKIVPVFVKNPITGTMDLRPEIYWPLVVHPEYRHLRHWRER